MNKLIIFILIISFHDIGSASDFAKYQILIAKKNSNTAILIPSFHGKNTLERPKDFDKSLVEILRNINGNVCLENDPKEITEQFSIPVSSYRLSLFNDGYAASGYFPKNNDVTSRLIHKLDLPREVEERYLRLGTPIDLQQRILNNILSIYQKSEQPAIDDVIRSSAIMFGRKVNYLESVDHVSTMMLTSLEDRDLWRNALTRLSDLLNCETCREKYVDLIRKFEEHPGSTVPSPKP